MSYTLTISKAAEKDFIKLRKSGDKATLVKLNKLLNELREHPYTGTGKPKPLIHDLTGQWSRRITKKHRLVYSVNDKKITVLIISAAQHYSDK